MIHLIQQYHYEWEDQQKLKENKTKKPTTTKKKQYKEPELPVKIIHPPSTYSTVSERSLDST